MGLLSLSLNLALSPYTRVEVAVHKKKIKLLKKHNGEQKAQELQNFP